MSIAMGSGLDPPCAYGHTCFVVVDEMCTMSAGPCGSYFTGKQSHIKRE